MTTSRALEYRITRHLLRRRDQVRHRSLSQRGLAERIITAAAVIAGAVLLGSLLQELLWALLAAGTVLTLGIKN
jgi:hypothetical protein